MDKNSRNNIFLSRKFYLTSDNGMVFFFPTISFNVSFHLAIMTSQNWYTDFENSKLYIFIRPINFAIKCQVEKNSNGIQLTRHRRKTVGNFILQNCLFAATHSIFLVGEKKLPLKTFSMYQKYIFKYNSTLSTPLTQKSRVTGFYIFSPTLFYNTNIFSLKCSLGFCSSPFALFVFSISDQSIPETL